MGHEALPAQPEMEMGSLFSLEKDCSLRTQVEKVSISNGLAWTADQKTMYYIDSIPRKVWAFDYDISTGNICKLISGCNWSDQYILDFVLS